MPIFGEAQNPALWQGDIYAAYPDGYVVQDGYGTKWLPRHLSMVLDSPVFDDPSLWERWLRGDYLRPPQLGPDEEPYPAEEAPKPLGAPGAAGGVVRVPVFLRLLTFKVDGKVVIRGTETAGIGIKQDGVEVVAPGDGTITVKQSAPGWEDV